MIKRILGGNSSPDDESAEQEEFGVPDPGLADLKNQSSDPYGGDGGAVARELEDMKAPPDTNP
jgi:hypothetical protein